MTSRICPRAILLDLDGTLADSLSVMRLAYQKFLGQFQVEPTDSEYDSLNGPPLAEIVRRLRAAHALEAEEPVLLANYIDVIDRAYASVAACPGAAELLEKARLKRCTVGIVTSNSTKRTQAWLETAGLSHLINFVVSSDEVQHGKPNPEPYLLASKRASCPSSMIVAVEDSLQGAQSAVDAGLKTFIVTEQVSRKDSWPQNVVPIQSLSSLAEQLW
jgi:HAD superfamily hydrolase (TIGR01509 family)